MPASSVDMIFADPPYNLSNGGFTCQGGRRVPVDKGGEWDTSNGFADDLSFHQDWIAACRHVLKDEGTCGCREPITPSMHAGMLCRVRGGSIS